MKVVLVLASALTGCMSLPLAATGVEAVAYDYTLSRKDPKYPPAAAITPAEITPALLRDCGYAEHVFTRKMALGKKQSPDEEEQKRRAWVARRLELLLGPEKYVSGSDQPPDLLTPIPVSLGQSKFATLLFASSSVCWIDMLNGAPVIKQQLHLNSNGSVLQVIWLSAWGGQPPKLLVRLGITQPGGSARIKQFFWGQSSGLAEIRDDFSSGDQVEIRSLNPLTLHLRFSPRPWGDHSCRESLTEKYGADSLFPTPAMIKALCRDEEAGFAYGWTLQWSEGGVLQTPDDLPDAWRKAAPLDQAGFPATQAVMAAIPIEPVSWSLDFDNRGNQTVLPHPPEWVTPEVLGKCLWKIRSGQVFKTGDLAGMTRDDKTPGFFLLANRLNLERENRLYWLPVPYPLAGVEEPGVALLPGYGVCLLALNHHHPTLLSTSEPRMDDMNRIDWAMWERGQSRKSRWLVFGSGRTCSVDAGAISVLRLDLIEKKLLETVPWEGSALESWDYQKDEAGGQVRYINDSCGSSYYARLCSQGTGGALYEKEKPLGRALTEAEERQVEEDHCKEENERANEESRSGRREFRLDDGQLIPIQPPARREPASSALRQHSHKKIP